MDIAELRAAMEADGAAWSSLLTKTPIRTMSSWDATRMDLNTRFQWVSGSRRRCIMGPIIGARSAPPLLASALNRQFIDVWDFGAQDGQVVEIEPAGGSTTAPSE